MTRTSSSSTMRSSRPVIVRRVSWGRRAGRSARASRSSTAARRALPLAVEWRGNDTPTAETVWRRCERTTWSMNRTRSPERTARSTVSPSRSDSAMSSGWRRATSQSRLVFASCSRPGPRRKPPVTDTGVTKPSSSSALTRRCTVDRGRWTSCASSASERPRGASARWRSTAAARVITCMLASGELGPVSEERAGCAISSSRRRRRSPAPGRSPRPPPHWRGTTPRPPPLRR